jgi:hypothetical protein
LLFFSRIVSPVFGMVKTESDREDCTSILFKAFRIELNLIFLYPNSTDGSTTHEPPRYIGVIIYKILPHSEGMLRGANLSDAGDFCVGFQTVGVWKPSKESHIVWTCYYVPLLSRGISKDPLVL